MNFDSRFYGGKNLRPRPEVHMDDNSSLFILATPWGNPQVASLAIEIITDYFATANDDIETTSPYPLMTCLTAEENHLRVAALLANEAIYRQVNQSEYSSALELLVMHFNPGQCSMIQVGQPSCLLSRNEGSLFPVSVQMDLAMATASNVQNSPLPSQLLGIDPTVQIEVKSFRPQAKDKLFLLSRSRLSGSLFSLEKPSLDRVTDCLAQDDDEEPFWLGELILPNEAA